MDANFISKNAKPTVMHQNDSFPLQLHLQLMRAYSLLHKKLSPSAGSLWPKRSVPPGGGAKLQDLSTVLSGPLVFIVVLKVTTLIERILAAVAPYLSSCVPDYVKDLGLTFLNFGSVLGLSLVFGNVLLSKTRDRPPIFFRPLTSSLGGWLIRRHIQRRLSALVCLYRFTIASGELPPEEEKILTERTEQASRLKDSMPARLQFLEALKYPSQFIGLLVILGLMQVAQFHTWFSCIVGCFVVIQWVLASKLKHLALEGSLSMTDRAQEDFSSPTRSIYELEAELFCSFGCSGKLRPVNLDVFLQILTGAFAVVGGILLVLDAPTAWWRILLTAILLLVAYTLVITPVRELIGREKRCTPKKGTAAHPDWRTELLIFWRSVNNAVSGPALLQWLVLPITLAIVAPRVIAITKAGLSPLRATLQDAVYFRGKIGQPLRFELPEETDGDAFTLQPLGSTRSCALRSGDIVTILKDKRTVDVVSSTGGLCPSHYQSQLSWRILSGLRGHEKNGAQSK